MRASIRDGHFRFLAWMAGFGLLTLLMGSASAQDVYYDVPVGALTFTEGALPDHSGANPPWRRWPVTQAMQPHAVLDGDGEAYIASGPEGRGVGRRLASMPLDVSGIRLAILSTDGEPVTGQLYLPNADWSGMVRLPFELREPKRQPEARASFYRAMEDHYARLRVRGVPGAAWFRQQEGEARNALAKGQRPPRDANQQALRNRPRRDRLEDTYALFTGGRAISENLQLDRQVLIGAPGNDTPAASVPIDSLTGITVNEMDWTALTKGLEPKLDPLAANIPADQHAIFFPTFRSLLDMMDEGEQYGTPVLQLAEPRTEDARTSKRYQRQLCLESTKLARLLGPKVIASVALTGSDPYLRTGSDVAILFETGNGFALTNYVRSKYLAAQKEYPPTKSVTGEVEGVRYIGVLSPDRRICSYLAALDGVVIVTNSLYQLRQVVDASRGKTPTIAELAEYRFFRDRYKLGEDDESALLMLSDATIRRWCGPRWRIGSSRRTRAAAVLAALQAKHHDDLVEGTVETDAIASPWFVPELTKLRLTKAGARSAAYGSLEFLTPIAELPLERVTKAEADAYNAWRNGYQRNWRRFFDPIAVQLSVGPEKVRADVTVMPLIGGSEYNRFTNLCGNSELAATAGDRHAEALLHAALAIDMQSRTMQQARGFASGMAPGLGANPFGWMGGSIALYFDDDPFWDQLANSEDPEGFAEEQNFRVPAALHVEVKNQLGLAAFLAALRAFVEQTAPNLTTWETLEHNGRSYVKVTPEQGPDEDEEEFAVYYATSSTGLTVTLNQNVLKRAIDRQAKRAKGDEITFKARPWIGKHLSAQANKGVFTVLAGVFRREYQTRMQVSSWSNLPILNEWKRRYPDADPVELYGKLWHAELLCPGGGKYVWNPKWQTMESTVYGHPGQPRGQAQMPAAFTALDSASFGVTFEHQGLRARVALQRSETRKEQPSREP